MKNNPKSESLARRILVLVAFGIAFGFIEAAVVVYLRGLFYPNGFSFPIAPFSKMPGATLFVLTETGREAATLVLLVSSAWLMARDLRGRLAVFLISFAVWDVFYYVWLKVILNWPASLFDWDILFLIPTLWAGPTLAPLLTSTLMCVIAAILLSPSPGGCRPCSNCSFWPPSLPSLFASVSPAVTSSIPTTPAGFPGPPGS